jgi:hypothetical protein
MSITITFPTVGELMDSRRMAQAVLPLLGAVLLPLAEEFVPGLGIALAVVKAAGVQVSAS